MRATTNPEGNSRKICITQGKPLQVETYSGGKKEALWFISAIIGEFVVKGERGP